MDFALKIKGEFLDLMPNTVLELEEENPFLQLNNVVQGQYSLPLTIPLTEKNMRLLGNPNLLNMRKSNLGIDAIAISNGLQHSRGQVKLESGQSNINAPGRGSISIYYLFGISDFYKNVENVYLTDCDYGPDISVPKGDFGANGDGTFWDYVMNVMENGTQAQYNFAIFPVVNEAGLTWSPSTNTVLNCISHFASLQILRTARFTYDITNSFNRYFNEICPFAYLAFVIKKVFEHVGWAVQGDVFNDPEFLTEVILFNKPIDYLSAYAHNTNVTWNMRDHVPQIKVGTFLLGLANRLGWWYDFDYRKKLCTINYRKSVFTNRTRKEFTMKAGANYSFKINATDKVHGLVQSAGVEKPDFSVFTFKGALINSQQLPPATAGNYYHLYFIESENNYYFCAQDENNNYTWEKSTDNNFDYAPQDHTDDITTCCLASGTVITPLYEIIPTQAHDLSNFHNTDRDLCLPTISILPDEGETETFYICYQHGRQPSMNDNSLPEIDYPFGSAGCFNLQGDLLKQIALVFEYKGVDNVERGLYAAWWQLFLNYMSQREELTIPVKLTLTDLLNIKYTDTLLIRNTEYFIKNPHFTLPVKEFTSMELVRV